LVKAKELDKEKRPKKKGLAAGRKPLRMVGVHLTGVPKKLAGGGRARARPGPRCSGRRTGRVLHLVPERTEPGAPQLSWTRLGTGQSCTRRLSVHDLLGQAALQGVVGKCLETRAGYRSVMPASREVPLGRRHSRSPSSGRSWPSHLPP